MGTNRKSRGRQKTAARRANRKPVLTKLPANTTAGASEKLQRMIRHAQFVQALNRADGVSPLEKAVEIYSPDMMNVVRVCEAVAKAPNAHWLLQISAGFVGLTAFWQGLIEAGKQMSAK